MENKENLAVELVSKITNAAIEGLGPMEPAEKLAEDYMKKYYDEDECVEKLIRTQCAKDTINGFITGLGGLITLPIALPADMVTSWVVQARMSAAIAYVYGYNINDDQVKTFVMGTLLGGALKDALQDAGIKVGQSLAKALIKKIPGKVLQEINKKLGIKLLTKSGSKGIIKLTKMVPVVGGFIGAGFNLASCRIVGNRAKEIFKGTKD